MLRASILVPAILVAAILVAAAPGPQYAPEQARLLALRAAQADGYQRLADLVLGAPLEGKTVGAVLGTAGDAEIALRVVLRSARIVGDPRVYSDGVAEVDLDIPVGAVIAAINGLAPAEPAEPGKAEPGARKPINLDGLRALAVDGYLRAGGRGAAPPDILPEMVKKAAALRLDAFAEMFPVGWEEVTAAGRVAAESRARVRAYAALGELLRGIHMNQTWTIGALAKGSPAAERLLDGFVRGLPLAGPVRLMPDRLAEVDVAAPVRDLIKVLVDIRATVPDDARWTRQQIDELSVQVQAERLGVTGRGMVPPAEARPPEALAAAPSAVLPDWAATVLEARGRAGRPEDIESEDDARLLAARSAKARAMADLQKQLDAVRLDDGRTVRDRAAKDEVFRKDVLLLLAGARIADSKALDGGRQWEVTLRLPLLRLWELARLRSRVAIP
jgi:hypothetical protein